MTPRLIWVCEPTETGREEEKIRRVFEAAPVDLIVSEPDQLEEFEFVAGDTVVVDNAERPSMHECIRLVRGAKCVPDLFLRGKSTPTPLEFTGIATLDGYEGLELTRARLLRAMPHAAKEATPEWRRNLVGQSRAVERVAEIIRLVGPRRCTVLITGETGTGKEVAAKAIHLAGPRSAAPFVALNCSAVPATLLESELFGHTRGAFTGAMQVRVGRFEQAQGGTLFLDEIGDMPLELQAKLLRVLQEREFQRLGSSETIRVDARVIAATNLNLRRRVAEGTFREDLYYRLNVVPLELPPLRAHMSDLRPLVEHFLRKICSEEQINLKRLAPDAWTALEAFDWPGNIRQLENAVSSAVILSENRPFLDSDDFPVSTLGRNSSESNRVENFALPEHGLDFTETVNAIERSLLSQALKKTGGNKKAAAEMLRLKRTTLSAKVRVLDVGLQVA